MQQDVADAERREVAHCYVKTFKGLKGHLSQALNCLGQGINCQQQDLFSCALLSYLLDAGRQALMMLAGCRTVNLRAASNIRVTC